MIWMLGIMTAMAQDPAVTAQTATSDKSGSLWADGSNQRELDVCKKQTIQVLVPKRERTAPGQKPVADL